MAPSDDPDEAADRLEHALERIAMQAGQERAGLERARQDPVLPSGASVSEIAERLDVLITRLRTTLSAERE